MKTKNEMQKDVNNLRAEVTNLTQQRDELLGKLHGSEQDYRGISASNEELKTEIGRLTQQRDELQLAMDGKGKVVHKAGIEQKFYDLVRGAEMQRLFHNPTESAMLEAAKLLTKALTA